MLLKKAFSETNAPFDAAYWYCIVYWTDVVTLPGCALPVA
jgi:hypothetical protein